MRKIGFFILLSFLFTACEGPQKVPEVSSVDPTDWEVRRAALPPDSTLVTGATYLSSYSQIYTETEHRRFNLTGTISMRNINARDSIYLKRAAYYDTEGKPVRTYFAEPIYLGPLETVSIVIDQNDQIGGTGDSFYFEWSRDSSIHDPLFEGVFISTYGQQGISFATRGVRIE